jgi:hypothetical protein
MKWIKVWENGNEGGFINLKENRKGKMMRLKIGRTRYGKAKT